MNCDWIKELKEGDPVITVYGQYSWDSTTSLSKVVRTTPTQIICQRRNMAYEPKEYRFHKKDGRGVGFHGEIQEATTQAVNDLKVRILRHNCCEALKRVDWTSLPTDVLLNVFKMSVLPPKQGIEVKGTGK